MQVKVYSPEESGLVVDHENLNLSSGNYETRSSILTDENAKCRVEFEKSYNLFTSCSRMQQDCQNYLLSLVLLRAQKRISEQALH